MILTKKQIECFLHSVFWDAVAHAALRNEDVTEESLYFFGRRKLKDYSDLKVHHGTFKKIMNDYVKEKAPYMLVDAMLEISEMRKELAEIETLNI